MSGDQIRRCHEWGRAGHQARVGTAAITEVVGVNSSLAANI
ncbi:MAG: hypothetical protein ACI9O0_001317 [Paracoccaceae bacterium]|jgi:hypothetical protein